MLYPELEKLIIESISERYCTFAQIRKFILAKSADGITFDELVHSLDRMILERKIVNDASSTISAYFDKNKIPSKYWLDGTGKVAMEFNGTPKIFVEPEISTEKIVGNKLGISFKESLPMSNNNMSDKKENFGRPKKEFNLAEVERYAGECQNDTEIGKKLGVGRNTVIRNKTGNPEFMRAYEAGKTKKQKVKNNSHKITTPDIEIEKEDVEMAAEQSKSSEIPSASEDVKTESLVIAKVEEITLTKVETKTRAVTVEIPINDYEQLLTVARLECYDTPQAAVLVAVRYYLEVDLECRRGDQWSLAADVLKNVLQPHNYGHLQINRDFLLAKLLEAIFEEREDATDDDGDKSRFIYTWDLRTYFAELISQEFVKQLIGEKPK